MPRACARSKPAFGDNQFDELKDRLKPVCHRTLRRQVLEYIRYTNRIPITQPKATRRTSYRTDVELMPQIQVLDFKPAPRLEPVGLKEQQTDEAGQAL